MPLVYTCNQTPYLYSRIIFFLSKAIRIGFNAIEYVNNEEELTLPVTVRKTQRLARPVSLLIESLTVSSALALGLDIPLVGGVDITAINPRIPIRARSKPTVLCIV